MMASMFRMLLFFDLLGCGQLQEDVFKTHCDRMKLKQAPAALNNRASEVAANVFAQLALDLEAIAAVVAFKLPDVHDARRCLQSRYNISLRSLDFHKDSLRSLQLESK